MAVLFAIGGLLLGVLAWLDIRTKKVSLVLVGILAVMMLGMRIASFETGSGTGIWIAKLFVGLLPGGISLFCSYITRGQIGMGDGFVLAALGLGLGFRNVMVLWGVALCMAAVFAIFLLVFKRAGKKTELPFVPCLFLGYVLCRTIGI